MIQKHSTSKFATKLKFIIHKPNKNSQFFLCVSTNTDINKLNWRFNHIFLVITNREAISLAIDNINNNTTTTTTTKNIMNHSQCSISPDDPRLKTPCFNIFPPQHQPVGCPLGGFNFSFNNCTVYFNGMQGSSSTNQVE